MLLLPLGLFRPSLSESSLISLHLRIFRPIYIKILYFQYVDTVFTAHRTFRHGYETDAPSWDFITSFFFTATMLTSIGYGFVVPFTFSGRLFVVIYCLIGLLFFFSISNIFYDHISHLNIFSCYLSKMDIFCISFAKL